MTNRNCDCRQGRDPCTCKAATRHVTLSREALAGIIQSVENGALFKVEHLEEARKALAEPVPPADEPIPAYFVEACDKFDWMPEEALRFYAEGKHFDTVGGRTRILCTGAIASHALKGFSNDYAELKGVGSVVPPAGGDVEVLGWRRTYTTHHDSDGSPFEVTSFHENHAFGLKNGDTPLVDRTHVTRLQAEVERMLQTAGMYQTKWSEAKAEVERLNGELQAATELLTTKRSVNRKVQSELTKARELLRSWIIQNPTGRAEQLVSETKSLLPRAAPTENKCGRCGAEPACGKMICEDCCYEPVAHQSAPAAKDGE